MYAYSSNLQQLGRINIVINLKLFFFLFVLNMDVIANVTSKFEISVYFFHTKVIRFLILGKCKLLL